MEGHDLSGLFWVIGTGIVGGIAWIGKQVIKPWSDAYLKKAEAELQKAAAEESRAVTFAAYVESMGKGFGILVEETQKQTQAVAQTNATLADMHKSQTGLCQAGTLSEEIARQGEKVMGQIVANAQTAIATLHDAAKTAAADVVDKAKEAAAEMVEKAKEAAAEVVEKAKASAEEIIKKADEIAIHKCAVETQGCPLKGSVVTPETK